uniref:Uncharacterized protein n=1 Tax=Cyprinus carpio TaxID=7962 RepID=A0A8C1Y3F4_CYPCA
MHMLVKLIFIMAAYQHNIARARGKFGSTLYGKIHIYMLSKPEESIVGGVTGIILLCLIAAVLLLWWRFEPNSIQLILTNPVACTSYTSVPQSSACGHVIRQTPNKSCSDCQAVSNFCIAFFFAYVTFLCHIKQKHVRIWTDSVNIVLNTFHSMKYTNLNAHPSNVPHLTLYSFNVIIK